MSSDYCAKRAEVTRAEEELSAAKQAVAEAEEALARARDTAIHAGNALEHAREELADASSDEEGEEEGRLVVDGHTAKHAKRTDPGSVPAPPVPAPAVAQESGETTVAKESGEPSGATPPTYWGAFVAEVHAKWPDTTIGAFLDLLVPLCSDPDAFFPAQVGQPRYWRAHDDRVEVGWADVDDDDNIAHILTIYAEGGWEDEHTTHRIKNVPPLWRPTRTEPGTDVSGPLDEQALDNTSGSKAFADQDPQDRGDDDNNDDDDDEVCLRFDDAVYRHVYPAALVLTDPGIPEMWDGCGFIWHRHPMLWTAQDISHLAERCVAETLASIEGNMETEEVDGYTTTLDHLEPEPGNVEAWVWKARGAWATDLDECVLFSPVPRAASSLEYVSGEEEEGEEERRAEQAARDRRTTLCIRRIIHALGWAKSPGSIPPLIPVPLPSDIVWENDNTVLHLGKEVRLAIGTEHARLIAPLGCPDTTRSAH